MQQWACSDGDRHFTFPACPRRQSPSGIRIVAFRLLNARISFGIPLFDRHPLHLSSAVYMNSGPGRQIKAEQILDRWWRAQNLPPDGRALRAGFVRRLS